LGILAWTALAGIAQAQTVYTWKDAQGVLHFSDEAPVGVEKFEKRTLEEAPAATAEGETPAEVLTVVTPVPPTPEPAQRYAGDARVVLAQHQLLPAGPSTRRLTGTVKNSGGKLARRVTVIVNITDAAQGSPCVSEELPVTPADLPPGGTGKFEGDIETPCFLGSAGVEINPAWD